MDPARLEQFKKIAEQYPDDEVARYGLGSLYLHLARYAEAEVDQPGAQAQVHRARTHQH